MKGAEMTKVTKDVVSLVQKSGFEFLWYNYWQSVFLLFDVVHIFKNIKNNWINLKILDKAFVYSDFKDTFVWKFPTFKHLVNLYNDESYFITTSKPIN